MGKAGRFPPLDEGKKNIQAYYKESDAPTVFFLQQLVFLFLLFLYRNWLKHFII